MFLPGCIPLVLASRNQRNSPKVGGTPYERGGVGGIRTYARRPGGWAMWSKFERGPGRGFGVNNLKHPHTLANQENETVSGVSSASARLSASCSGGCTPLLEHGAADRLDLPDWGHFSVPNPGAGHPPLTIARGRPIPRLRLTLRMVFRRLGMLRRRRTRLLARRLMELDIPPR